jgi:uncharacterized protein GlcG (DUF336 family)
VFFKLATGDRASAVQPAAPLYTIGAATTEQLAFLAGGIRILDHDGELVGAIGSGGGTPEPDAEIAAAAIEARS